MTALKFWVAAVGGAASVATTLFAGDTVAGKVAVLVLAAATAGGVYLAKNAPQEPAK